MKIWYYTIGLEREGPVSADEIRRLIASGRITREAYIWRKGMQDWEIAEHHPEYADAFVTPPPVPVPQPLPGFEPEASEPLSPVPAVTSARPWPRFWARLFDTLVLAQVLAYALTIRFSTNMPELYLELVETNKALLALIFLVCLLPLIALLLAFSMAIFAGTPGKYLAGVKVPVPQGRNALWFHLVREFKVWFFGLGMGVPLATPLTLVAQYIRVMAARPARYDDERPPVVVAEGNSGLIVTAALAASLALGNVWMWTVVSKLQDQRATIQTWVNPVTGKTATLGKAWLHAPGDSQDKEAAYFYASGVLAKAVFAYEPLPRDNIDPILYGKVFAKARASDFIITSEWQPVVLNGVSVLRARGETVPDDTGPRFIDTVEVFVAVKGRQAWRSVVLIKGTPGYSSRQDAEAERFVNAMFGTLN